MSAELYGKYVPKYIQIKETIKSRIRSGHYKRGEKLLSRIEMAREFSTTLATCSKAVSELLAEKEIETLSGVGTFISDRKPQQKLKIYGMVRTLNNPFYGKFSDSLARVFTEGGFQPPKIISSQYDSEAEAETVRGLLEERGSIIVMCGFLSPKTRLMILENPDRFYIFGRAPELEGKTNQIATDTEQGAFLSTKHLVEMGHRNIAMITGEALPNNFKVKAYKRALQETGLMIEEKYIVRIEDNDRMDRESLNAEISLALDKFLRLRRAPTAVFCASDFLAVSFISVCQMRGLRIPDDISVCGYDGAFEGLTGALRLSTAAQPLDEIFNAVLSHASSGLAESFLNLTLPSTLREGNTVKIMEGIVK